MFVIILLYIMFAVFMCTANAVKCNEDQAMFIQFREYDLYHEIEIQVNFSDASFYWSVLFKFICQISCKVMFTFT